MLGQLNVVSQSIKADYILNREFNRMWNKIKKGDKQHRLHAARDENISPKIR